MKHLQKFNEALEDNIYSEIQQMIDANQFLKGKVTATKESVFEAGDFILLLDDLSHITDAHVDETIPGSKFEQGIDLKKAIISLVSNNKPSEMTKGFGAGETKVTNPEEAEKFKWLGLDSKIPVGIDNIHKSEPNSEEFKSMNLYKYKDSRGNEFSIKVKEGEGEKTTFLSFIGAKLGRIGDKTVLSVITAFPGQNGASVANRNDFEKLGYYFTTTSKEVIEKSVGQTVESFKKMKHIKDFKLFESGVKNEDFPQKKEIQNELKSIFKDIAPLVQVDRSKYGDIILVDLHLKDSDNKTNYDNLDNRYKTISFVNDTIKVIKEHIKSEVYLSAFSYLGEVVKGKKDGETVENVLPKLKESIKKFKSGDSKPVFKYRNVASLSFLIK